MAISPTQIPQLLQQDRDGLDMPLGLRDQTGAASGGTAPVTGLTGGTLDALGQWALGELGAHIALGLQVPGFDPLGQVRKGQR